MPSRKEAAELFAQMVFDSGYREGVKAPFDAMAEPLGHEKEKWQKAAETFARLDDEEKACFRFLLGEAVHAALFHVLVDLDGASGYHEIGGRDAEFTLGLRIFDSTSADSETGPVAEEIAIARTEEGEDLHDIFAGLVDDAQ